MKYYKIILLLAAVFLLLTACKKDDELPEDETGAPPIADEVPVVRETYVFTHDNFPLMDGSPSTAPLAQAIAAAMLGKSRDDVAELALFNKTTQAFRNLSQGLCDIIIAGEPSPVTIEEIERQDFRYDIAPIATDALVFVVNASNPISDLSTEQVKAIYSGNITGWHQVGGNDSEITAFQRHEEATSQVLMEKLVMDWQYMTSAPMYTYPASYFGIDSDVPIMVIRGFDNGANAIGYTMYHYAVNMGMADGLKILSIDGVMPTTETISNGTYPFLSPYFAVIDKDLPEDDSARILYNWLISDEGQNFIRSEGYVSVKDSTSLDYPLVSPPEMMWNVLTDNSKLTPYDSPRSHFSRLSDSAMTELIPSDNYGSLLLYSSAYTLDYGSTRISKYGFVTESGIVITDLIYDFAERATFTKPGDFFHMHLPVYLLGLGMLSDDPHDNSTRTHAVCASDGSWVTSFSYTNVFFREEVMFLMRDFDSFDIDVYDYSGKLLYNMLELEWAEKISADAWPEQFIYSVNEGFGSIHLDNDTFALLDVLTGSIHETEFTHSFTFSDGLAAVMSSENADLWGFVNKDLEFVIPPEFLRQSTFVNDYAVVETSDGSHLIINKEGQEQYSVTSEYMIIHTFDGTGFTIFPIMEDFEWQWPIFLTNDFREIEYPAEASPRGPESYVVSASDGWYICYTENSIWLFNENEQYSLPTEHYVIEFIHGFIVFNDMREGNTQGQLLGVIKPDGSFVIPPTDALAINPIVVGGEVKWFALNNDLLGSQLTGPAEWTFTPSRITYKLFDSAGQEVKADLGILIYDEASEYMFIQGADYFAWLDITGETLVSIPSLAYMYD